MDDWVPLIVVLCGFMALWIVSITVGYFLSLIDEAKYQRKRRPEPSVEWKVVEKNGHSRTRCREVDLEGQPISLWEPRYIAGKPPMLPKE